MKYAVEFVTCVDSDGGLRELRGEKTRREEERREERGASLQRVDRLHTRGDKLLELQANKMQGESRYPYIHIQDMRQKNNRKKGLKKRRRRWRSSKE